MAEWMASAKYILTGRIIYSPSLIHLRLYETMKYYVKHDTIVVCSAEF